MTELRIDQKRLQTLNSLMAVCDAHAARLEMASRHIAPLTPLKPEDFLTFTDEQLGLMELLISRFGKLQDVMGSKLFPLLLELRQQDTSQQSFLDILHRLEKVGLLPSTKEWIDMRELRNHLTHEYPDNPDLMANNLNKAVESAQNLLAYWRFLRNKAQIIAEDWLTELKKE